jgi:hypothetical protein
VARIDRPHNEVEWRVRIVHRTRFHTISAI